MVINPKIDPCQVGGFLDQICDRNKFNKESGTLRMLHWVVIGNILIFGDVLKWFPQVKALFDPTVYAWINLLVDGVAIAIYFVILGFPGLLVALPKLVDTSVYFIFGAIFPILNPIAYWVEMIPWFMLGVGAYFLYKGFILKKPSTMQTSI